MSALPARGTTSPTPFDQKKLFQHNTLLRLTHTHVMNHCMAKAADQRFGFIKEARSGFNISAINGVAGLTN